VIGVLEGDVTAAGPMRVRVVGVDDVRWCGHGRAPSTDVGTGCGPGIACRVRRAVPRRSATACLAYHTLLYSDLCISGRIDATPYTHRTCGANLMKMVIDPDKLRGGVCYPQEPVLATRHEPGIGYSP
jgi:hypothetical protein